MADLEEHGPVAAGQQRWRGPAGQARLAGGAPPALAAPAPRSGEAAALVSLTVSHPITDDDHALRQDLPYGGGWLNLLRRSSLAAQAR
jgi:hypothetical protein